MTKKKLPSPIGNLPLVYSFFGVLCAVCWTVKWLVFAFLPMISAFFKSDFFKNGHVYWNLPKQLVLSFTKQKSLLIFTLFLCLLQSTGQEKGVKETEPKLAFKMPNPKKAEQPKVHELQATWRVPWAAPAPIPTVPTAIPDPNMRYYVGDSLETEKIPAIAPLPMRIPPPVSIIIDRPPPIYWPPRPPEEPEEPPEILLPQPPPQVPMETVLAVKIILLTVAMVVGYTCIIWIIIGIIFAIFWKCKKKIKERRKVKAAEERQKRRERRFKSASETIIVA